VVPDAVLNPKKKIWETVQPQLKTSDNLLATYEGKSLKTSLGEVRVKSLKGVGIK